MYVRTSACVRLCVCMRASVYVYVFVCARVRMCVCARAHVCVLTIFSHYES